MFALVVTTCILNSQPCRLISTWTTGLSAQQCVALAFDRAAEYRRSGRGVHIACKRMERS